MSSESPTGAKFTVEVSTLNGVDHVVVRGEMDVSTTSTLREVVLDPAICAQPVVLVDLTHTAFIDSSGVAALVVCHRKTRGRGAEFVVACPEGLTGQVLDMVGLPGVVDIRPDAEACLAALGCAPHQGCQTRPGQRQVWRADPPGTMSVRGSSHL